LLIKRVGERSTGQLAGCVPARGEQGIAGSKRIGRLLGQAGVLAGSRDTPGLGQHLEEQAAAEGGPAVAAGYDDCAVFGIERFW